MVAVPAHWQHWCVVSQSQVLQNQKLLMVFTIMVKILLHKHDSLLSTPKNNTTHTSLHFCSYVPVCFMYLCRTCVMWSWAQRQVTHRTVCSCFLSEAIVPFGHYKRAYIPTAVLKSSARPPAWYSLLQTCILTLSTWTECSVGSADK